MGAVTFRYHYVFTILTSPAMTPVSPHGAAGQQAQTPHFRPYTLHLTPYTFNQVRADLVASLSSGVLANLPIVAEAASLQGASCTMRDATCNMQHST